MTSFVVGGAMTHAAMLSGKYEQFHINDLHPGLADTFVRAIKGELGDYLTRWVSREEFLKLKDTDPIIAMCWSFGNDCKTYLYGKNVEPWKKALHYAICFDDYSLLNEMGLYPEPLKGETIKERRFAMRDWCKVHEEEIRRGGVHEQKRYLGSPENIQRQQRIALLSDRPKEFGKFRTSKAQQGSQIFFFKQSGTPRTNGKMLGCNPSKVSKDYRSQRGGAMVGHDKTSLRPTERKVNGTDRTAGMARLHYYERMERMWQLQGGGRLMLSKTSRQVA